MTPDKEKKAPTQMFYIGEVQNLKKVVQIYLLNGIKLEGIVVDHDIYCLVIENSAGNRQLIYKHAISTINV